MTATAISLSRRVLVALWTFALMAAAAHAGYDIGAPTSGPFAKIGSFMQEVVDFIDGPFAMFFTVISIIFCAILYAISPKSGGVGMAVRVFIAVMIAINVATWIVALKG